MKNKTTVHVWYQPNVNSKYVHYAWMQLGEEQPSQYVRFDMCLYDVEACIEERIAARWDVELSFEVPDGHEGEPLESTHQLAVTMTYSSACAAATATA